MNLQEFADSVTDFNELNTSNLVLIANTTESPTIESHVNTSSVCIKFMPLTDGNSYLHAYLLTEDTYSYGLLTSPDIANISVKNSSDIESLLPVVDDEL